MRETKEEELRRSQEGSQGGVRRKPRRSHEGVKVPEPDGLTWRKKRTYMKVLGRPRRSLGNVLGTMLSRIIWARQTKVLERQWMRVMFLRGLLFLFITLWVFGGELLKRKRILHILPVLALIWP